MMSDIDAVEDVPVGARVHVWSAEHGQYLGLGTYEGTVLLRITADDGTLMSEQDEAQIANALEQAGYEADDAAEFARSGIPNPRIKLDDGSAISGIECWWTPCDAASDAPAFA